MLSHEDDVPDDQDGEESLPVIPSGGKITSIATMFLSCNDNIVQEFS